MKNTARIILLFLGDITMLLAAFFAMLAISFPGRIKPEIAIHVVPFSIIGLIWLLIFFIFNLYNTTLIKPTIPHLRQMGIAFSIAMMASVSLFYIMPGFGITPKTNMFIFGTIFMLLFLIWRRIFYSIFATYFRKSVAIITTEENEKGYIKELIDYITKHPQSGFFIKGNYSSVKSMFEELKGDQIDTIIVSKNALKDPNDLKALYKTSKNLLDIAYAYEDILGKIPIDSIDNSWVLYNIQGINKNTYRVVSRVIGIMSSILVLITLSPVLIIVAISVKLCDKGPVFYTQTRIGRNNKVFRVSKFRSMAVDAERNGAAWAVKNDSRVTPVGKIIRKLHIDELPQLWSVIKGDMDLIGPRPERPEFVEKLEQEIPFYNLRHIIAPGFTGWAQIKFKYADSVLSSKEKFEYDLYYIKNRNIFMDLGILVRTVQIIFTH